MKTQFGYHIIRVEQHDTKPFNDVKTELGPELAKQQAEALKAKANVQLDDAYFAVTPQPGTPAVPAPAPAPGQPGK